MQRLTTFPHPMREANTDLTRRSNGGLHLKCPSVISPTTRLSRFLVHKSRLVVLVAKDLRRDSPNPLRWPSCTSNLNPPHYNSAP